MMIKVLGSAAGGGLPQWNCNGRNSADARKGAAGLTPRTQASVAVTADGAQWVLLNAAPDLRQQINETPELHPDARRRSAQQPDQGGGADQWRRRCGGGLLTLARGPALHRLRHRARARRARRQHDFRRARRRVWSSGSPWSSGGPSPSKVLRVRSASPSRPSRCRARFRSISKTPRPAPDFGTQEGDTAGLKVTETASGRHFFYVPGCAKLDDALRARLKGAPLLFFDGTLYTNDEMIAQGLLNKTGERMGHMNMSGSAGSIAELAPLAIGRKIFIHINNSNPGFARRLARAGGGRRRRVGDFL